MSSGLIEVTGEVARSTELKVALGTPILNVRFWGEKHFCFRRGGGGEENETHPF